MIVLKVQSKDKNIFNLNNYLDSFKKQTNFVENFRITSWNKTNKKDFFIS